MAFCTNEMDGIDGSLNETRWSYAPTGRRGIAQGKAKHWSCQRSPIDASRRPSKRPAEGLIPSSERISPGTFQNTAR